MEETIYKKVGRLLDQHGLHMMNITWDETEGGLLYLQGLVSHPGILFGPYAELHALVPGWDDLLFYVNDGHVAIDMGDYEIRIDSPEQVHILTDLSIRYPEQMGNRYEQQRLRMMICDDKERERLEEDVFTPLKRHFDQHWLMPAFEGVVVGLLPTIEATIKQHLETTG